MTRRPSPFRMALVSLALFVLALSLGAVAKSPTAVNAADCSFRLGFATLRNMIPAIVGDCLVDEHHGPNGDGLQETTGVMGRGGLLVWRKADNWTAYTDGYRTWVNGPCGLTLPPRLNTDRLDWERDWISNPWGYNLACHHRIENPPPAFCQYFACIPSFPDGNGYVMQCRDGMFSKSGGRPGSCSSHGGNARALLSP